MLVKKVSLVCCLAIGFLLPQIALAQESGASQRLDLMCLGGGVAVKPTVTNVQGSTNGSFSGSYDFGRGNFNGSYDESYSGTAFGTRDRQFADQVNLWIERDEGRIRMPRTMLPVLRGGENGWFRIRNIEIDAIEITGSISVNPINNPKLRIDRTTGMISISGKAGDYVGQCERYRPNTSATTNLNDFGTATPSRPAVSPSANSGTISQYAESAAAHFRRQIPSTLGGTAHLSDAQTRGNELLLVAQYERGSYSGHRASQADLDRVCGDGATMTLLGAGGTVRLFYLDPDGAQVGKYDITPAMCAAQ